jgi:hypothetical protein
MNGEDMGHEVEYRTDHIGRLEAIAGTCVCMCVCVCVCVCVTTEVDLKPQLVMLVSRHSSSERGRLQGIARARMLWSVARTCPNAGL